MMLSHLLLLLLLQASMPLQEQGKPEKAAQKIALSEQEQQGITRAAQIVRTRDGEFKQALNAIADCPLEPSKTLEVVAKVQTAMARSQAAQAEFDKLIAELQAKHVCAECQLTPDGRALSKLKEQK